jgi:hypothetical protein
MLCTGDMSVCNATTGMCVPSAMGEAPACKDNPDGSVCVTEMDGGVHCGCVKDVDCGESKSGMVCDPIAGRCVHGYRGRIGNLCPDGEVCSPIGTTIGTCSPAGDTGSGGSSGSGNGGPGDEDTCGCAIPGDGGSPVRGGAVCLGLLLLGIARRGQRGGLPADGLADRIARRYTEHHVNFDDAALIVSFHIGSVGFVALAYGKKQRRLPRCWWGFCSWSFRTSCRAPVDDRHRARAARGPVASAVPRDVRAGVLALSLRPGVTRER